MERDYAKSGIQVEVEPGRGLLVHDLGSVSPSDGGCVLEFTLRLKDVCPEARTALALTLTELDGEGREHPRGIRTQLASPHHGPAPADVEAGPIRFALPAALDVSGGGTRRFLVRVDAQCVDCHACCRMRA